VIIKSWAFCGKSSGDGIALVHIVCGRKLLVGIVAGVGILGTQDLRFTLSCLNVAILGTQDLRFKPSCLNDEKGALVLAGGSDIGGTVGILGILMQDFDPPFFPKPSEFIKKMGKIPRKGKVESLFCP
jgi:hypothetical protein